MSFAANMNACWSTNRFTWASACSGVRPEDTRLDKALVAAGLPAFTASANWVWCRAARFSQNVVEVEGVAGNGMGLDA